MGAIGRICGRPARNLMMWFCICDVIIAVVGLCVMPFLILDKTQAYFLHGVGAEVYYGLGVVFGFVGFYGAYGLRKSLCVVSSVWLIVTIAAMTYGYVRSVLDITEICAKIADTHPLGDYDSDACTFFYRTWILVAGAITIAFRLVYVCVSLVLLNSFQSSSASGDKYDPLMDKASDDIDVKDNGVEVKGKTSEAAW